MMPLNEILNEIPKLSVDQRVTMLETVSRSLRSENIALPGNNEIIPVASNIKASKKWRSPKTRVILTQDQRKLARFGFILSSFNFPWSSYLTYTIVNSDFGAGRRTPPDNLDRLWVWLAIMGFISSFFLISLALTFIKLPYSLRGIVTCMVVYLTAIGLLVAQVSEKNLGLALIWVTPPAIFAIALAIFGWVYRERTQWESRQVWFNEN